jgi:hypothetical protein
MTTIFQLNYIPTELGCDKPVSYHRTILCRCDIKEDINKYLKGINDIYDFKITILLRSENIFELDNINLYDIFITELSSDNSILNKFTKVDSINHIYIKNSPIVTITDINSHKEIIYFTELIERHPDSPKNMRRGKCIFM